MQPQPLERRVERLEARVTVLEQLPARVDELASQISLLRTEMRAEFSAVRDEIQVGDEETRRTLRDEIRAGDEETRRRVDARADEIMGQAKTLYEDMKSTIKLLGEGR